MGLNPQTYFALLLLLVGVERLAELRSANSNFRRLIERGGREFGAKHYPRIVAMHVAFFASLIVEFVLRGAPLPSVWPIPFAIFVAAQGLRFWVRQTMGQRWTSRVIVVPGERLIASGPFRVVPHPIYIAVVLELLSLPLIFGLYLTCVIFSILNTIMLLGVRIPCERAALTWSQHERSAD